MRQYVKLCDRIDFNDPALDARIGELVAESDWVHRKHWELALASLFLEEVGAVREDAQILDVGAGHDSLLYWLANRVRRVVAVDLYGEGEFVDREAAVSMLTNPEMFAPFAYRRDHLEVRHMDARRLEFDDDTFDAVFSLSSVEHFGIPDGVRAAAVEVGRVLRPGGHAFIVTECFIAPHASRPPLVHSIMPLVTTGWRAATSFARRRSEDVFTWREIAAFIIRPSGLRLMQDPELRVSAASFENLMCMHPDGRVESESGLPSPHIVLRAGRRAFTSIALALEKPA